MPLAPQPPPSKRFCTAENSYSFGPLQLFKKPAWREIVLPPELMKQYLSTARPQTSMTGGSPTRPNTTTLLQRPLSPGQPPETEVNSLY